MITQQRHFTSDIWGHCLSLGSGQQRSSSGNTVHTAEVKFEPLSLFLLYNHCFSISFTLFDCVYGCSVLHCCLEPHESRTQKVRHPVLGEVQGPTEHMKGSKAEKGEANHGGWNTLILGQSQRLVWCFKVKRSVKKRLREASWKQHRWSQVDNQV